MGLPDFLGYTVMGLSPAQTGAYRQQLQALLDGLVEQAEMAGDSADVVELDQSRVGRLSRMDALQAQAMSRETRRRRSEHLGAVRSALARIDSGEYGDCVECGAPIPTGRLDIDPAAALCLACAEASER